MRKLSLPNKLKVLKFVFTLWTRTQLHSLKEQMPALGVVTVAIPFVATPFVERLFSAMSHEQFVSWMMEILNVILIALATVVAILIISGQ